MAGEEALSGKALSKALQESQKQTANLGLEAVKAGGVATQGQQAAMDAVNQASQAKKAALLSGGMQAAGGAAGGAMQALLTPEQKEREAKTSMPQPSGLGIGKSSAPQISLGRPDLGPQAGRSSLALEMLKQRGMQ